MLCLSLAGATVLLVAIFALYQAGLMSMVVAVWAAVAVFVIAAIYEIFLLSLVLRHMLMGDR